MVRERIVVGATGDDTRARVEARRLRDAGQEVVLVGGGQTPEHLLRAVVAEDATGLVVDTDAATVERIASLCRDLGIDGDVAVTVVPDGGRGVSGV